MSQRILVVEDDRAFANLLVRAIEGAGYVCATASDGRSALDAIAADKPDCVLLDLLLPKKDGRAVLGVLQASEETADIPVLAMSGVFRGRSTARELQEAGAQGFLEKPFPTRDLIAHLHAVIGPPEVPAEAVPAGGEETVPARVSLADCPAAELLWEAMQEGFTGAVQVRNGKLHKVVILENGVPRQVRSNSAHECLGRRLFKAGKIDEEALNTSLRRTKEEGIRQGECLVDMGVITQAEIDAELSAQSRDKFLDVFGWEAGECWRQAGVKKISYATDLDDWTARLAVFEGSAYIPVAAAQSELREFSNATVIIEDCELSASEGTVPQIAAALASIQPGVTVGELLKGHAPALYALSLTGVVRLLEGLEDVDSPSDADADVEVSEEDSERVVELNELKAQLEDQSHFERLGLDRDASGAEIRTAFLNLAKRYHPDRFSGESEAVRAAASETFALLSSAHDTLIDDEKREAYIRQLDGGPTDEQNRQELKRIFSAEQKFSEGEGLFKRRAYREALAVFSEILQIQPDEADFHAYYGYTHFLVNNSGAGAARMAREHLEKAISLAPQSPTGYYFLGQLHKACEEAPQARKMFRKVLELRPDHMEASRELRLIEMRTKTTKSKGGLFRFGRKKT